MLIVDSFRHKHVCKNVCLSCIFNHEHAWPGHWPCVVKREQVWLGVVCFETLAKMNSEDG